MINKAELDDADELLIFKLSVENLENACKIGPYCMESVVQYQGSVYLVRHYTTAVDIVDNTTSHQIIQVGTLNAFVTDIHDEPIDMSVYGVAENEK